MSRVTGRPNVFWKATCVLTVKPGQDNVTLENIILEMRPDAKPYLHF